MSPAVNKNTMESTVKIARLRDSHGGEPVLQIVQPLKFTKTFDWIDCDERDLLVQDFMQRQCHVERNNLFRVANVLQVPGDDEQIRVVTLIEPVKQEDVLELLKWKTLGVVLGEENLSECAALANKKMDANQEDMAKCAVKCPDGYAEYLKISEFFAWVNDVNRSNSPTIPLPRTNNGTIRDWFENLPERHRAAAFANVSNKIDIKVGSLKDAFSMAFGISPDELPEYWVNVLKESENTLKQL